VSTVALSIAFGMCAMALPASGQPKAKPPVKPDAPAPADPAGKTAAKPKGTPKEQNFNFEGLGLNGRSRSPQLLIFLERANEELERASLEKRSFIPHIVRTVEEEAL
jgi:hypothetical protein